MSIKARRSITWLALRVILIYIGVVAIFQGTALLKAQIYTGVSIPSFQFLDSNGAPISGGKLYTCQVGTTCTSSSHTTQTTYTTYLGPSGSSNANPVVLDSAGRATIYFSSAVLYKLTLNDSTDATTYFSVDGVRFGGVDSLTGTGNQVTVSASTGSPVISLAGPHNFTTQTQNGVLIGNATGAITATAAGSSSMVLMTSGGTAPSFTNSPQINTLVLDSTTFANLGTPSAGTVRFCSNCLANGWAICAAAGTGAIAIRVTSGWIC